MTDHPGKARLQALIPSLRQFQSLASEYGIVDMFQDNGGKILQVLIHLNLTNIPGREGNDAKDADGHEYELKSLNLDLTSGFSTHHHMNPVIIAKYREVFWIFAVYHAIELHSLHVLSPVQMEAYYTHWEAKWHGDGKKDINNPKVPLKFVQDYGMTLFDVTRPTTKFPTLAAARLELVHRSPPPPLQSEPYVAGQSRRGKKSGGRKSKGKALAGQPNMFDV